MWRYSCNLRLFCKDQNYARCLASQSRRTSSFFLLENRRLNGLESRFLFDVILFGDNPLEILSYYNAKINSYLRYQTIPFQVFFIISYKSEERTTKFLHFFVLWKKCQIIHYDDTTFKKSYPDEKMLYCNNPIQN